MSKYYSITLSNDVVIFFFFFFFFQDLCDVQYFPLHKKSDWGTSYLITSTYITNGILN